VCSPLWMTPVTSSPSASSPSAEQKRLPPSRADILQARVELDRFDRETGLLETEFARSFEALQRGALSQQDFSNRLQRSLVPQWQAIERELTADSLPIVAAAPDIHEDLIRSALDWEHALRIYDAGLRVHDEHVVVIAFEYLRQAEDARRRADERIRELEDVRASLTP
jgi:thioesterase domain-containing protein